MIRDPGKLPTVYLKPGEMYISSNPTLVSTVLGSCVSVTMFNYRLKVGAICHGLLPSFTTIDGCAYSRTNDLDYVDQSIEKMFSLYETYGIKSSEIEVKLFGGADVLLHSRVASVGIQNVQTAIQAIKSKGLNLISSSVGGISGRRILFYTHTGEVFLKRLIKS